MRFPRPLRPGDRVAVISPAGPVTAELLSDGLATLRSWGLAVEVSDDVFARRPGADYVAGTDAHRQHSLHKALCDPDIAAIFCSRGGYGAMRILPMLDPEMITRHPKLLVGFSDITALHLYFAGVLGLPTLHGPVIKSFYLHRNDPHASLDHLKGALFGTRPLPFEIEGLRTIRGGSVRGRLLGGNLSLITSLLSTNYCPDLDGAILFIEDVGEEDYRLDRLFTTLRLSKTTANLGGLVLGDFTQCNGSYVCEGAMDAFIDALAGEFSCPVVSNFPSGHGNRNVPIPMGLDVHLDADRGRLTFFSDAVSAAAREL